MRFHFLAILLALPFLKAHAQDSTYYHTAFNSKDDSLKLRLHNIIKDHVEFTYTSSSTDVWDILKESDKDTANTKNVILLYSNRGVDAAQEYNSGKGWNREHVWAKSRGDFGTSKGAGTDVHHLRPCDVSVNSVRNNRNFDNCKSCSDVIDDGFNTGSKRDANLWTFQPPDNVKGDVARMIFYMAVRYEGEGSEPDLELTNTLQGNTSKAPLHAVLNTLLEWNRADPVDQWERNRNAVIYSYQKNKNPFIDYPVLAEHLWGDSIGIAWKKKITIGVTPINKVEFTLLPNPSNDKFIVTTSSVPKSLSVVNSNGVLVLKLEPTTTLNVVNLANRPKGLYFIVIESGGNVHVEKVIIN
jgi:endonuclease I